MQLSHRCFCRELTDLISNVLHQRFNAASRAKHLRDTRVQFIVPVETWNIGSQRRFYYSDHDKGKLTLRGKEVEKGAEKRAENQLMTIIITRSDGDGAKN